MCQLQTYGQLIKPYHIIHLTNTYIICNYLLVTKMIQIYKSLVLH